MTIKAEPPGKSDEILAFFGKRRAVFIPPTSQPYGYYVAVRESFLRALLRPKNCQPPKGWVYWDDLPDSEQTGLNS